MPSKKAGPVSKAAGEAMRAHRESTTATGDWVAAEANALARLGWDRSTVSKIENGTRALTVEELLLLPTILTAATGRRITLAEVLAGDIKVGNALVHDGKARHRLGYRTPERSRVHQARGEG
jgi:hypothetical protein